VAGPRANPACGCLSWFIFRSGQRFRRIAGILYLGYANRSEPNVTQRRTIASCVLGSRKGWLQRADEGTRFITKGSPPRLMRMLVFYGCGIRKVQQKGKRNVGGIRLGLSKVRNTFCIVRRGMAQNDKYHRPRVAGQKITGPIPPEPKKRVQAPLSHQARPCLRQRACHLRLFPHL